MKSKRKRYSLLALASFTVSLSMFIFLWWELGQRGLEADANGTSGYTTNGEIATGLIAVVLLVTAFISLSLWIRARRQEHK